ncbi:MAG: hypothetical protein K6G27_04625 [Lachnospiraceae bacterium]|nr:hypothetical protein [Lachnospiraceae bacterium]
MNIKHLLFSDCAQGGTDETGDNEKTIKNIRSRVAIILALTMILCDCVPAAAYTLESDVLLSEDLSTTKDDVIITEEVTDEAIPDAPVYLTPNKDFEVVGYTDNIKNGTAKVTLRGIGKWAGTNTLKFSIKQKRVRILAY